MKNEFEGTLAGEAKDFYDKLKGKTDPAVVECFVKLATGMGMQRGVIRDLIEKLDLLRECLLIISKEIDIHNNAIKRLARTTGTSITTEMVTSVDVPSDPEL